MAGKIIADTLEHSTAGSIATNYVVNGVEKVWSNFNGTGTIALRDSLNVASLTDYNTGEYIVNFTTAMANTNYTNRTNSNHYHSHTANSAKLTTSNAVYVANDTHSYVDVAQVDLGMLGDLA
jgi:hypothetical protein